MEKILKCYNKLIQQFQDNKNLVEEYYFLMMTVCMFFHENSLIIEPSIYDYIFKLLVQELNGGKLGVLEINEEYYKNVRAHSMNGIIVELLNEIKNNLDNPTELGSLVLRFKSLEKIYRKGWIMRGVEPEYYESDAIHTMQMFAIISMYNNSINANNKDDIDVLKVYEMILIHEIGESVIGDIAEIEKEHKDKRIAEEICIKQIFGSLKCSDYFINLWLEFEAKETKEAKLAYEIDKLDPVLKASYLDKMLKRNDIFEEFFEYEVKRDTFRNSKVKELFLLSKEETN